MNNNLYVSGSATVSALNVTGPLIVTGSSTFIGPVTMNNNLYVSGSATISALNVTGPLIVTGSSTFIGAVTMDNTLTVSGLATFKSGLTSEGQTTVREICETIYSTQFTGSNVTASWSSGNIYYITPTGSNITLNLTNLPNTTYSSFNFAAIINSSSSKNYITSVNLFYSNGGSSTSNTIYYNGGSSINVASANVIIQTFNAINVSTVPTYILTSVSPFST
jgi:hypothetical protein